MKERQEGRTDGPTDMLLNKYVLNTRLRLPSLIFGAGEIGEIICVARKVAAFREEVMPKNLVAR